MTKLPPHVDRPDEMLRDRHLHQLNLMQEILVSARFFVGEGADQKSIYELFDRIEILPALIASDQSSDEQLFFETVEGLADLHPIFRDVSRKAAMSEHFPNVKKI